MSDAKSKSNAAHFNDGGPAYPHPGGANDSTVQSSHLGMTLREWFAGQCIVGVISLLDRSDMRSFKSMAEKRGLAWDEGCFSELSVKMSFEIADAMLAARKVGEA